MTLHSNTPGNIVWLNGTFDVLHTGHIKLFRYARMLAGQNGQVLVGIDTDERVQAFKGPTRPVNSLSERMLMLMSIKHIDTVTPFSSDWELETLIYMSKPDYMVIGDDYRGKRIIGAEHIKEIVYITRDEKSTSNIVNR